MCYGKIKFMPNLHYLKSFHKHEISLHQLFNLMFLCNLYFYKKQQSPHFKTIMIDIANL